METEGREIWAYLCKHSITGAIQKSNCYLIVESAKLLEIFNHKLDDHLRMEETDLHNRLYMYMVEGGDVTG